MCVCGNWSHAGFDCANNLIFWEGSQFKVGGVGIYTTVPTPAKETWMRITFAREAGMFTIHKDGVALANTTMRSANMIPKDAWRP
jgi:hypothetical protein